MQHEIKSNRLDIGTPYPLGATKEKSGINFAFVSDEEENCGILLYSKKSKGECFKLPFSKEHRMGQIWCGFVACQQEEFESYQFYEKEEPVIDPYAKKILPNEQYGFYESKFNWGGDIKHKIPYEESILYCIHVKGFTKHVSSKVKARGTFLGIIEKIPYLKELGVTTLELMPAYEFDSTEKIVSVSSEFSVEQNQAEQFQNRFVDYTKEEDSSVIRTNYWGYKFGHYFVPKTSYTYGNSPENEFKELVKVLHQNQMELIMQFYFPGTIRDGFILEVLKHWVVEYHIDGFHLKGENIPISFVCSEPLFQKTKIFSDTFISDNQLLATRDKKNKNIAFYGEDFMYEMRKFLKGDEGQINGFLQYQRRNFKQMAVINFIANYYGFTLHDLVSYEIKHNEENGEENQDGTDYNVSWNCGVEGPTKRKAILLMRKKQMKNAMCLVFLAQGTPLFMSGDEFGRTQKGNNNPYCQDNEISWVNWNLRQKNQDLFDFTAQLIKIRKSQPILRGNQELKMLDSLACGYQDISYHGEEAFRPCVDYHSRYVGIMYCGRYAQNEFLEKNNFVYVVYNMHWEKHEFALPKLPKGMVWERILTTGEPLEQSNKKTQKIELEGRTICIYIAK